MNDQDINYLKQFAQLCVDYFAEDDEFGFDGWTTHLDNASKLGKRIYNLLPIIQGILRL